MVQSNEERFVAEVERVADCIHARIVKCGEEGKSVLRVDVDDPVGLLAVNDACMIPGPRINVTLNWVAREPPPGWALELMNMRRRAWGKSLSEKNASHKTIAVVQDPPSADDHVSVRRGCPEAFLPAEKQAVEKGASKSTNSQRKFRLAQQQKFRCANPLGNCPYARMDPPDVLPPTADVDHILRRADGGADVDDNMWVLCAQCHAEKTRLEPSGRWQAILDKAGGPDAMKRAKLALL
jgi:hypothetical protein